MSANDIPARLLRARLAENGGAIDAAAVAELRSLIHEINERAYAAAAIPETVGAGGVLLDDKDPLVVAATVDDSGFHSATTPSQRNSCWRVFPTTPSDPRNRRVSIVVRSEAAKELEDAMHAPIVEDATGEASAKPGARAASAAMSATDCNCRCR